MGPFRKSTTIIFSLLLGVGAARSQNTQVDPSEFSLMFLRGQIPSQRSVGVTYRFRSVRERPAGPELIIERSEDGSVRAVQTNVLKTSADECILIGDIVFERSAFGEWYSQTLAEYKEAQSVRSDLMKKALSSKDTEGYKRLSSEFNPATGAAINQSPHTAYTLLRNFPPGASIIADGTEIYKGRRLRRYIAVGIFTKFDNPLKTLRYSMVEYRYAFDYETGFLVKGRSKIDWVYDNRTDTHINSYEWELDPRIVIQAPKAVKKPIGTIPVS